MLTAHLRGGLGNQMFIIAAITTHAKKLGYSVAFTKRSFNHVAISDQSALYKLYQTLKKRMPWVKVAVKVINKAFTQPYILPHINRLLRKGNFYDGGGESQHYESIFNTIQWTQRVAAQQFDVSNTWDYVELPAQDNLHFTGYFQNLRYFSHNRRGVTQLFHFDHEAATQFLRDHTLNPKDVVVIHVRRGDYRPPHPIPPTPKQYIEKALEYFPGKTPLFVTHDREWVSEHFPGVLCSNLPNDWDDMSLMILCHNHIIWASTFSWWGAWLANKNNVIAPLYWDKRFNVRQALIPSAWSVLDYERSNV